MKAKKLEIRPVSKEFDCGHHAHLFINGEMVKNFHVEFDEKEKLYQIYQRFDETVIKQILEFTFAEISNNFCMYFYEIDKAFIKNTYSLKIINRDNKFSIEFNLRVNYDRRDNLWEDSLFEGEMSKRIAKKIINLKIEDCTFNLTDSTDRINLILFQNNSQISIGKTIKIVISILDELENETHLHFLKLAAKEMKRIKALNKNKTIQ